MFGLKPDKLSIKCQLAIARTKLVQNRKLARIRVLKEEVANLLKSGQEANARIHVEQVIREEQTLQAYTILETYLLLLQTRAGMLKKVKEVPQDMHEAIVTIMFAAERVKYDLDELPSIAGMLMSAFRSNLCAWHGKTFPEDVVNDTPPDCVGINAIVVSCLSANPAGWNEKVQKLAEISQTHNAPFDVKKATEEMKPKSRGIARPSVQYTYAPATSPRVPPGTTHYASTMPTPPAPPAMAPAPTAAPQYTPAPAAAHSRTAPEPKTAAVPAQQIARQISRQTSGKDGWAPLPPLNHELGYTFGAKLESMANCMGGGYHRPSTVEESSTPASPTQEEEVNELLAGSTALQQEADVTDLLNSETAGQTGAYGGREAEVEEGEQDADDHLAKLLAQLKAS